MNADQTNTIVDQVQQAIEDQTPLKIVAGNSKIFYGNPVQGKTISLADHRGVIEYEPSELVITVRSGTPMRELEKILHEQGQMLAFEPPHFGEHATIGGTIACGFSGPSRPYFGAARDFVLGCKIINGNAEVLQFGGRVIKNVAGYDVSRLMTGALGTLGILLEVSLKVLPIPKQEMTLIMPTSSQESIHIMCARAASPLPLTAACYDGEQVYLRLSGNEKSLRVAKAKIAGDELASSKEFWHSVKEQTYFYNKTSTPLWRLSLPPATPPIDLPGQWFIDWGGAQRWLKSDVDPLSVRNTAQAADGHATLFRFAQNTTIAPSDGVFHPLEPNLFNIHQKIKHAFDPKNIFNRDHLYNGLFCD